ncbi:4-hydroxyproline epimerase [Pseudoalteromonas tunicata]|uniref:4-hydroxyproline epimerase n=1 Tax=Pseudoalteromonas tunicata TaxID=314281 RepID=UPI00273E2576|nr:4-hydroxyproline epimerase [Pseudoalteromonas tunicata]MDP4984483.1 4-hydroxyproline epimerase [Pseudoalteromonas tunicata]MDP5215028.1 4-hydroxyproline epimerase [Pseudoalteromonas tunicata]
MIKGTFFCIDAHTCGNPVRLVTSGHPILSGSSMGEKRVNFINEFDWIRKALMFEPRGHDMMSGAFLYPPCSENADVSILFIETSGCLPMCGHGTIGTLTAGLEAGLIKPKVAGRLIVDVPAGQLQVEYQQTATKVDWVKIYNIASYLAHENIQIDVPELGSITLDIAYGGNFYAIIEPQLNYPGLQDWSPDKILKFSPLIREIAGKVVECIHPLDAKVNGLSHVMWTGAPQQPNSSAANAVFYGDKAIDRSPCGTGTSARMAQLYAKGLLKQGEPFVHESIIGSQFVGKIESVTEIAGITAIMPSIQGWARVTGHNQIIVDDEDPYAFGFQVV